MTEQEIQSYLEDCFIDTRKKDFLKVAVFLDEMADALNKIGKRAESDNAHRMSEYAWNLYLSRP